MSDLEKYLQSHRFELDRVEPLDEDRLWASVRKRLESPAEPSGKKPLVLSWWKNMAIAASLAALAGWGILLFRQTHEPQRASLADISPELAAEEAKLQHLIRQKEAALGFDQLDREAYAEIFQELEELEHNTAEARNDLPGFQTNDRLVKTLLQHYELKIRILEHLSNEIEKRKYYENLEKSL